MMNFSSNGSKKKSQTLRRYMIFVMVTATFILISTSSVLSIYANRGVLKAGFERVFQDKTVISYKAQDEIKDRFWAKQVLKGGYILHFRHAERDKWLDVELYDLLETKPESNGVNQTAIGEEKFYKNAVCLNNRGLVQAKAMGQIIRDIGLPTNWVVSSPSCRARQTAELTFGGYDQLDLRLLHQGVYTENKSQYIRSLIKLYKSFDTSKNKNVIVTAHNGVINSEMFINGQNFTEEFFSLEEGGFYIISNLSSGLKLEYKFTNFKDYVKQNYTR